MADFAADTRVSGGAGRYRAEVSRDWEVWGPFGGYVAAIALRAFGAASDLPRPASFHCLFLAPARFEDVEIRVGTARRGKRSQALQLHMEQGGKEVLRASAWTVADELSGLEHDHASAPAVPGYAELRGFAELAEDYDDWYPLWRAIEGRPVIWGEEPRVPKWHAWMRLLETPDMGDPFLEAARTAMWADMMMWNAAVPPHLPWPIPFIAPSLDLSVVFHDSAPRDEWLLCDSEAPFAGRGTIGCSGRVWSPSGRLLASATSNLLCRPTPLDDVA